MSSLKKKTNLYDTLLNTLPEGQVSEVCVGLHWTAVVANVGGTECCGLAATMTDDHVHGVADVPQAGQLESSAALALARLATTSRSTLTSIGAATINALLPPQSQSPGGANASEVIADYGKGKTVALIGHFPFIEALRPRVGQLDVLELSPAEGELPAEAAPEILPKADVVAMTSMTLLNHTFQDLVALCSPEAVVMLLGPSTPLSPVLFDHGIDLLSGAVVTDIPAVMRAVKQGANFRQIHQAGAQLVTFCRSGLGIYIP